MSNAERNQVKFNIKAEDSKLETGSHIHKQALPVSQYHSHHGYNFRE